MDAQLNESRPHSSRFEADNRLFVREQHPTTDLAKVPKGPVVKLRREIEVGEGRDLKIELDEQRPELKGL